MSHTPTDSGISALVADLRNDAIAQHIIGTDETKLTAWRLDTSADLIEAQAAELATLRAERDAAVERCAVACDKIAGNTADFSRDHRRAAGQCAAMIRSLKGGA